MIKKLFTKIKDYFISFFKWFKEKVMSFFKSKTVERRVEKLKTLIDTETIDDKDFNKVLKEIRAKHARKIKGIGEVKNMKMYRKTKEDYLESPSNFPNFEIFSVIKPNGQLFDLDEQYARIAKIKKDVLEPAMKFDFRKVDTAFFSVFGSVSIVPKELNGEGVNYADFIEKIVSNGWVVLDIHRENAFPNVSLRYFYSKLSDIDKLIDDAEKYAKRCEAEIAPSMRKIEQQIKELDKEKDTNEHGKETAAALRKLMNYYYFYIKASTALLRTVTTYIRLLGEIDSRISGEAYITETGLKFEHLYHLSDNVKLADKGELVPVFPSTGLAEFLPKRTSFAETVEGAYYGTGRYWLKDNLKKVDEETYNENKTKVGKNYALDMGNGVWKRTICLYEGLPDENTRFIKPKLIESLVSDAHISKEICTTTPVKIRKVGLIEVEFRPTKSGGLFGDYNHDHLEYGKFIGYRLIDEE